MEDLKPQTNTEPEAADAAPSQWLLALRRIWRRVENAAFGIVATLIFLYFLLQSSLVQNWLIGKITNHLSSELNTTVEIQHVDISFFDNLVLEGFFVADLRGDTLLYVERLKAGLNSNIFSLLQNQLEFDEISLTRARVQVRKMAGDSTTNLQFLLDYFAGSPADPNEEPSAFQLRVKNVQLTDVQFLSDDKMAGKRMYAKVGNGAIRINKWDFLKKNLDVPSILLEGVVFAIAERPPLEADEDAPEEATENEENQPLQALIGKFVLRDAQFYLDKYDDTPARHAFEKNMDFAHLAVRDIVIEANSVTATSDLAFHGKLRHMTCKEQCGFSIQHLEANEVFVNDTTTALYGMRLETNGSAFGDTLALRYNSYHDYERFTNGVYLDGRFAEGSKVRLGDIMFFSKDLEENAFFVKNRELAVDITGYIDGRINRLNGRSLRFRLGDDLYIAGNFDGDDMAEGGDRMRLFFDLERAKTNMRTVRMIIPGFDAPDYFDRLGNINFSGTYQILFGINHILTGDLSTQVGHGNVDMKLDLGGGAEKATYSGFLNMINFDMDKWTGNSDFGKSTFRADISEGTGLTLETLKARLNGTIDSLYFRGYNYQDVAMNGRFEQSVFTGHLDMEDPNMNFTFDGTVNLRDSIPEYDFKADLNRVDLGALNLVDKDWVLSGKIQKIKLFARNLDDLRGAVVLRNFRLVQDKKYHHNIDSLTFAATTRPNGNRNFILLSDIADGILEGRFEVNKMAVNALRYFYQYYPNLARQAFQNPEPDSTYLSDNYKLNIHLKNTRGLTRLLDPGLDTLQNVNLRAKLNAKSGTSEFRLELPSLRYNGLALHNADLFWTNEQDTGRLTFGVPKTILADGREIANIRVSGDFADDAIKFTVNTEDSTSVVQRINLRGLLSTADTLWQVHFNAASITLFDDQWYMEDENYLRFSSSYFEAKNFDLMNGFQRIRLESYNEGKGARFSLANFDLDFFERFFRLDGIRYRGKIYNLDVEIEDLFAMRDIRGYITTDTVFLNGNSYGSLSGNVELPDANSPVWWRLFFRDKDKHQLRILGTYVSAGMKPKEVDGLGIVPPGEFLASVQGTNFPLQALELIVPDISKTQGSIGLNVMLGGPFDKIGMRGQAVVDGSFQFDYLKARFYLPNEVIQLSETQIWADKDTVLDGSQKNAAIIRGGLRHDHFQDWEVDCSIKTLGSDFLVMNTTENDNDLYYGQGIGSFEARFSGSFSKADIRIDAVTGKETRLYIPLSASRTDIKDASFITFRDKNAPAENAAKAIKRFASSDLKGLNLEMNLSITDDAEVQLIFDEQAGDIVKGRGDGNLRIVINREGEFKMYGTYQIRRGEYMFTLLNLVNKPFTVADGGTITWYGDPYGAQINLDATYAENTSLYNLLQEELAVTNNLNSEATKSTRVVVTMRLKGDLFKPHISFDLSFPNLSSQLKSLADSKMAFLRQDQNELTRQVFGLIVVGSFLPSTGIAANVQSSDYLASAFNTLTQVLSNQFSSYLTTLASEWFGGAVSSIEFNIAYNEYRNRTAPEQPNTAQVGRELQVRLRSGFANDRITVQLGSQFGIGQPGTSTADGFLGEDVTVEIQITENRQWQLKVYQRTEPDIAGGSRRSRYGFGISFRKEYDTFANLMHDLTGWFRKSK
ncbi:MAG: translocation/assembly module TamB domain-containing protein [Saprospiraceae bacterium]